MPIITVTGAVSGSGVSMTAQCMAEYIAKSGKSTIYISEHDLEYMPDESGNSLDTHRSALANDVIGTAELEASLGNNAANLRVLAGCRNPLELRYYQPEAVDTLCGHLREIAEYIVIDGGSNVNSGLHIGAIEAADRNVLVLTQQERAVKRWLKRQEVVNALHVSFSFVLNLFVDQPKFYSVKQIQELLELDCLGTLPDIGYGWQCEQEKTSLLALSKDYEKALKSIVTEVTGEAVDGRSKRGIFGRKGR